MQLLEQYLWTLWLAVLPGGPMLGFLVCKRWVAYGSSTRRFLLILSIGSIALAVSITLTPFSIDRHLVASLIRATAYVSASCLLFVAFRPWPRRTLTVAARSLATLVGYTLCFGAFYQSSWDLDASATSEKSLGENLVLIRTSGGMFAQNWEGVTIQQRVPNLPLLRKTIYMIRIGETDDCNEKTVAVHTDFVLREVIVQCDGPKPYVWAHIKMP